MRKILTFLFLLAAIICSAQTKMNVYFLKNDGHYVTNRDSADYIRIVTLPDSGSKLYNISEYYLNNQRKSIGKSSKIDPPWYEGPRIEYYNSGLKRRVSNYKNGRNTDDAFEFYPNGKPYLVEKYPSDSNLPSLEDFLIEACYDSTGTALASNGNGAFKLYDNKFKKVVESGNVKDGKRDGQCTGEEYEGKWKYTEQYENGALISGVMIDEKGITSTYSKNRATNPVYKGGLDEFYKYLGRKIDYPDADREKNISGTVVMSFVVEKDGKLSDFKILHSVSPDIDKEALRVMRNSPSWTPGTFLGRPVRVIYTIPISFSLQ